MAPTLTHMDTFRRARQCGEKMHTYTADRRNISWNVSKVKHKKKNK